MLIPNKHNGYSRDGRRLYYMDGGSDAPAAEQKASTELPEWAKPYAKDILAKGQALTDVNQNPYQTYNQDRIAGFSPMQQQAMQGAQNMTVAPQTGEATAGATMAGIGGLGVAGQANPYGFQQQVGGYMNPYMNQILAPQLAEANRQYDIGATRQQSAATQAGAFGGSREAIMAAENERNRNTGLNQIYGQGLNTAFGQAQNQYNQGLQNQLAGYGLMNQSAANLGQLGQNQYGQQMGINQLQSQYGGQQQAQMQRGLDTAYQDFTNQQNYPYKQLGFMSDMIRGLPLGQQSTTQMYQAPPSGLQTASALGLGAYGINQLSKADGGSVHGYADGGEIKYYAGNQESVTSEDNVRSISRFLPAKQLPASYQMAAARGDLDAEVALQKQMAENKRLSENASIDRGLGGAFNSLPPETQDGVVRAAGGGILAFSGKNTSFVAPEDAEEDDERLSEPQDDGSVGYTGTPTQNAMAQAFMASQARLQNIPRYSPLTRAGRTSAQQRSFDELKEMAGPDPYGAFEKSITEDKETSAKVLAQNKGFAALQAIPAILQGGNALRGIGAGAGALGAGFAEAAKSDRAEKRYLNQMQFHLADAKRKENMGLFGEARKDVQDAESARLNAVKEARARTSAEGANYAKMTTALRQPRGAVGSAPKPPKVAEQNYNNILADLQLTQKPKEGESSTAFNARIAREASKLAVAEAKTSDIGANKLGVDTQKILSNASEKAADFARKAANVEMTNKDFWGAKDQQAKLDEIYKRIYNDRIGEHATTIGIDKSKILENTTMPEHGLKNPSQANPNAAPAKATTGATGAPDIKSVTGAPAGATIGRQTIQGYEILDSSGKLIGYAKGKS
jgi:hypothetical protein